MGSSKSSPAKAGKSAKDRALSPKKRQASMSPMSSTTGDDWGSDPAGQRPPEQSEYESHASMGPRTPSKGLKTPAQTPKKSSSESSRASPKSGRGATSRHNRLRAEKVWPWTHRVPTASERRQNEREIGRNLTPWFRPRMVEKLLLTIQYECTVNGIRVPWDQIAHRFHAGSTGDSIIQHLTRLRPQLIAEGHLVPPAPCKPGALNPADRVIRGFIRDDTQPPASEFEPGTRPVYYSEPVEDLKEPLPDYHLWKRKKKSCQVKPLKAYVAVDDGSDGSSSDEDVGEDGLIDEGAEDNKDDHYRMDTSPLKRARCDAPTEDPFVDGSSGEIHFKSMEEMNRYLQTNGHTFTPYPGLGNQMPGPFPPFVPAAGQNGHHDFQSEPGSLAANAEEYVSSENQNLGHSIGMMRTQQCPIENQFGQLYFNSLANPSYSATAAHIMGDRNAQVQRQSRSHSQC